MKEALKEIGTGLTLGLCLFGFVFYGHRAEEDLRNDEQVITVPSPTLVWSCVDDGDKVCAPGNDEGKPAACYDDGGVIVALWPCHTKVDENGDRQVYYGEPATAHKTAKRQTAKTATQTALHVDLICDMIRI